MTPSHRQTYQNQPKRLFVDASHTIATGRNSGIERVVRNIVSECGRWCEDEGLPKPQLVTHFANKFAAIDGKLTKRFRTLASIEANVYSFLPRGYLSLANWLCKHANSARLKKWLTPQTGHLGVFKLPHSAYKFFINRTVASRAETIKPNENDLFVLPDAYWTKRGVWQAAAAARENGATIATVIYDLIPLTHPQYVGAKRTEGFQKYLHHAIENSDLIVTISQTVELEIKQYIQKNFSQFARVPTAIRHLTLGAELKLVEGEVRSSVNDVFTSESSGGHAKNPYLMVATFDPRKNHHYLLDAFDLLWKTRTDLRLCLIGRVGSLCEDVVQRIRNHPAYGKQLFAFHDIKDSELQHCYQFCRGVIFPSIVEGFGLPIVESLWFGKRTFASDTPIHREVGRSDCVYFDLNDTLTLVNAIEKWELVADKDLEPLPTRKPTTWEACSRALISHCINTHQSLKTRSESTRAA
jgi:O-antigen biosynthesis alpha-1,2-rhamnosyltransferase